MLKLYSIFHLNLAYSSIEENQRAQVIECCYWPLLRLARKLNLPFGIEAPAYTLNVIAEIDPAWLAELYALMKNGSCEFIGSGYAQIIGPLVPAAVNRANLRLGLELYERLFHSRPRLALVNEQAYSSGLVKQYLEAGFKALVMEWDNPFQQHPEWSREWRYLPQFACDQHGNRIPLIWNKSIAFQKFQRYAHAELELDEYYSYLKQHLSDRPRAFPMYGNDVEIFDFRPGRYQTEPVLNGQNEWARIEKLFEALLAEERFSFIRPSQVLDLFDAPGAGNELHLESPEQPVPVKKQGKYNLTRWAVTGRNNTRINTDCWRIFEYLKDEPQATDVDWRELCYLWSSDFRTHITEKRWTNYQTRLKESLEKFQVRNKPSPDVETKAAVREIFVEANFQPRVERKGRYLDIETENLRIILNCRRGLALDKLWFKSVSEQPLVGTLAHGYYEDIDWGADYYTGHLVFEMPGQPKVTDLNPIDPTVAIAPSRREICVSGCVATPLGPVTKTITLKRNGTLDLEYALDWTKIPLGSLRIANITLNPEAFDAEQLYFETHNGGTAAERFHVGGRRIDHGRSVSFLVSASGGLGMTENQFICGDAKKRIAITTSHAQAYTLPLVTAMPISGSYFFRAAFSVQEIDETSRETGRSFPCRFRFNLAAFANAGQGRYKSSSEQTRDWMR